MDRNGVAPAPNATVPFHDPHRWTTSPRPPNHHPQPRCRLSLHCRSRPRSTRGRDRRRSPRWLLCLRPFRAVRPRGHLKPQHGGLRPDRSRQERVCQDVPVAPGGVRTKGLGGRSQGRVRAVGPGMGGGAGGVASGWLGTAQPPRHRGRVDRGVSG